MYVASYNRTTVQRIRWRGVAQVVVVLTVWLVDACLKLLCFVLGGLSLCMVFQLLVEFVQVCVFHMFHVFLWLSSLVGVPGQFPS